MPRFRIADARLLATLLLCGLVWGCASGNNVIAGSALTVENVAETVQRACGNTVPDGPCRVGSLIETEEKAKIKLQLLAAQDLLEFAARTNTNAQARADALGKADEILAAIELLLIQRGIQ